MKNKRLLDLILNHGVHINDHYPKNDGEDTFYMTVLIKTISDGNLETIS